MTLLFLDGFDHLAPTIADLSLKYTTVNSNATLSLTGGRVSGNALRIAVTGGTVCTLTRAFGVSHALGYVGLALRASGYVGQTHTLIQLLDGATVQVELQANAGNLQVLRSTATVLAVDTVPLSVNQWYFIEFRATIDPTAGAYDVRVNGTSRLSGSGVNTRASANSSFNTVNLGTMTATTVTLDIDDLYICNGAAGLGSSGFIGDLRVATLMPSGAGNYSQFTRTGGNYSTTVINDAPTIYWRLDESSGTAVNDFSGAGRNGLINGGVTQSVTGLLTGDSDTAYSFNGSTGFLNAVATITLTTTFTVECWFSTTTAGGGLIGAEGSAGTGSGQFEHELFMNASGQLVLYTFSGSADQLTTVASYNNGARHHVVATQSSAGKVIYVDGVQAVANAVSAGSATASQFWHVGYCNAAASKFWNGTIDEVAIWNATALTATQVANHYARGSVTPSNFAAVNELPEDQDVSFAAASATGLIDSYTTPGLPASISAVRAIQWNQIVRRDDVGSRTIAATQRSAGADYVGATSPVPGLSYTDYLTVSETSLATGSAWGVAEVNASEFGIKVIS